ncbi:hypothetical protein VNO77_36248 [Canavalia gladiata]|uniref:Uncharacterized protein n=1 Tax=Canavalia gladiata TaxID=3824 RepID=A0AAN9K933_CANGL
MQKRRGRPQKLLKDDFDEEVEKVEYDNIVDNFKNGVSNKAMKDSNATKQGRKRKRNLEEKIESVEKNNGVVNGSNSDELIKSTGFRHNGNRRKSKPRRAAETGVLCKQDYVVI